MDNDMILLLVVVVLPYRFKISISHKKHAKQYLQYATPLYGAGTLSKTYL